MMISALALEAAMAKPASAATNANFPIPIGASLFQARQARERRRPRTHRRTPTVRSNKQEIYSKHPVRRRQASLARPRRELRHDALHEFIE